VNIVPALSGSSTQPTFQVPGGMHGYMIINQGPGTPGPTITIMSQTRPAQVIPPNSTVTSPCTPGEQLIISYSGSLTSASIDLSFTADSQQFSYSPLSSPAANAGSLLSVANIPISNSFYTYPTTQGLYLDTSSYQSIGIICSVTTGAGQLQLGWYSQQDVHLAAPTMTIDWDIYMYPLQWIFPNNGNALSVSVSGALNATLYYLYIWGLNIPAPINTMQPPALNGNAGWPNGYLTSVPAGNTDTVYLPPYAGGAKLSLANLNTMSTTLNLITTDYLNNIISLRQLGYQSTVRDIAIEVPVNLPPHINYVNIANNGASVGSYDWGIYPD
jgi:hypothetical protein